MFNKTWLTQFKNCHQLEMVLLMDPCTCVAVQLRCVVVAMDGALSRCLHMLNCNPISSINETPLEMVIVSRTHLGIELCVVLEGIAIATS